MKEGKVICDWCGMDVCYWEEPPNDNYYKSTPEDAICRHKRSRDPTLECLHQDFISKNLLESIGVTTA